MVAAHQTLQETMQWFSCNRGRAESEATTTMTRTERTGTMGAQGLERAESPATSSLLEQAESAERRSSPQKKGREEEDDKEDEVAKCWNCTRRKVECV